MTRIAYALLPRFELALLARREGAGLWRRRLAIADLSASPAVVREATPAAERAGVRPGMTLAQARVLCGDLAVQPPAPEARAAAEAEILAALARLAPRLASDGRGAFFLGLAGMGRLVRDERDYAARIREALAGLGFAASVGIAGHPFAAWVAARRRAGPVAPGSDARFLASVPLADLDLSGPARALLALLGITTAGQVARLPRGALGRRLGAEGERLDRLCRGEHLPPETVPTAARVPRPPDAAAPDLDGPTEGLEPLLFILKGLLDRLLARVAARRMALAELTVEAELDDPARSRVVRRLAPAEPTLDARAVMDLVRLWLEGRPLGAVPRALRLVASRVAPAAARQLRLLARREDEGEAALERAVARLASVLGEGAVVRPALADRYRPEGRVRWVPAGPAGPAAPLPQRERAGADAGQDGGPASAPLHVVLRLLAVPEPVELTGGAAAAAADAGGPAVRAPSAVRPPSPARAPSAGAVRERVPLRALASPRAPEEAGPAARPGAPRLLLRKGQPPRRIVRIEAVQRVSGEWWDAPFDRTYAWAVCEEGERFWLFHDHLRGGTFLHAVAD